MNLNNPRSRSERVEGYTSSGSEIRYDTNTGSYNVNGEETTQWGDKIKKKTYSAHNSGNNPLEGIIGGILLLALLFAGMSFLVRRIDVIIASPRMDSFVGLLQIPFILTLAFGIYRAEYSGRSSILKGLMYIVLTVSAYWIYGPVLVTPDAVFMYLFLMGAKIFFVIALVIVAKSFNDFFIPLSLVPLVMALRYLSAYAFSPGTLHNLIFLVIAAVVLIFAAKRTMGYYIIMMSFFGSFGMGVFNLMGLIDIYSSTRIVVFAFFAVLGLCLLIVGTKKEWKFVKYVSSGAMSKIIV